MTMAAAGMRMAEQTALTTPSQMDATNILRLSSPQKAKNFFQSLKHLCHLPSSFTLMWASHMVL